MDVRLDIDLLLTRVGDACVRTWTIAVGGAVVARHETLGAALAASVYLAEAELRRTRGVRLAKITFPLPDGMRAEMYCAPTRDRVQVLHAVHRHGATPFRESAATT